MQLAELPQASVALYVLVRDLLHPVPDSALRTDVIAGLPVQMSVAVGVPIGNMTGLQPRFKAEGQNVNTGAVTSTV
jgi:hypothetical protein